MQLFKDAFQNDFGTSAFGYTPYGGPDVGEITAVAEAIGAGDDDVYYRECMSAGDRLAAEAATSAAAAHRRSAGELLLRAACFYGLAFKPLYGTPVDARLKTAFGKEIEAFTRALDFLESGAQLHRIPYERTTLPGCFLPALNHETERRALIVFTNGFDSNVVDSYLASAIAASRRGYHTLVFDGPGQGELLFEQSIAMRPDWEVVVSAVLDYAMTLPHIDTERIVLSGWSLGGYLALRAASAEPRIAGCIADPGLPSMLANFGKLVAAFGLPANTDSAMLDDSLLQRMTAVITQNRQLRWSIVQRGFWVLGAKDMREFFRLAAMYTLDNRVPLIGCPTLITAAEEDPLSGSASALYDDLQCAKTLLRFTALEGAGSHCEMQNRSLLNRRVLDWVDQTFAQDP